MTVTSARHTLSVYTRSEDDIGTNTSDNPATDIRTFTDAMVAAATAYRFWVQTLDTLGTEPLTDSDTVILPQSGERVHPEDLQGTTPLRPFRPCTNTNKTKTKPIDVDKLPTD